MDQQHDQGRNQKISETNQNEDTTLVNSKMRSTTIQNLQDTRKAILRGKFRALQECLKK